MKQEQLIQFQIMEQEANQLKQQLQLIEQNISEVQELKSSLDEIEKPDNEEILACIGKGIYLPVKIKEKKLSVEVGNKNFVKKTIPETKKIIDEQINKLNEAKQQIMQALKDLQNKINDLVMKIDKNKDEKKE